MRPLEHNAAELLRAAVKPRTAATAANISQLVRAINRWEDVIEGAREHGILPLLYPRLTENHESIPSDALLHAKREFERNAFHCMTNAEELLQVLGAFQNADIAAMPFK